MTIVFGVVGRRPMPAMARPVTRSTSLTRTGLSAGKTLTFVSGADTTLAGAVLSADQVQGVVGGDLTIQSLQDTSHSHSTQTNVSASATFGYGASVSASYGHASSHASYANVVQQSGIEAGNGGFQVAVGGNTSLVGGLLTSNQTAVNDGLNTLITGTLNTRNLHNVSNGSASTMGLGASLNTGATFGQALKDDPDNTNLADPGNDNYLAANGGKYGFGRAVVQNLMNHGNASRSSSGQTLSAVSAGAIQVRGTTPGTAQTITTLGVNARTSTNMQLTAPDVATLQENAADEQTGNQLLFNAGSWVTDHAAVRYRTLSPRHVVGCNISASGKNCHAEKMTAGSYGLAPGTTFMPFLNGINNDLDVASGNAGDLATLYSTPESAPKTLVVNLYSDGNSVFANALDGAWDAINANWFHGALGNPAGAQALASIAQQVRTANTNGARINMMVGCHSDGCAQTSIAVQNDPSAFDNMNSGSTAYMLFAEPSAHMANVQSVFTPTEDKNHVAVAYSCNPNDPVCSSALLGNNPATEKTSQGCFTMMSSYECSGGYGISWDKLAGQSVHSDIGISNIFTPSASLNGQTVYSWGYSGNPLAPGNPPAFSPAPGAPKGLSLPARDITDGGNRTFAPLLKTGTPDTTTINFPTLSVAGSTADHVNYATLLWPGGNTANLRTALSALNGLPTSTASSQGNHVFAPGSTGSTGFASPATRSPSTGAAQSRKSETPTQQRCIALTGDTERCLQ